MAGRPVTTSSPDRLHPAGPLERDLPVRVTVVRPPPGVAFAVQRGRAELLLPCEAGPGEIRFDFVLRVAARPGGGEPDFLGPYAQGTPADRFVYVGSGKRAGQADSGWDRRAKVKLSGIGWDEIERVLAAPGARLEARIEGTGRDGGPACASVPLVDGCWKPAGERVAR
ncbi:MAG TPA: DUF5990 family protein [Longimicrobiaceae bacterium]|nr:DUF5990 family protein [Longimicrobiaceae bacterium]